MAIQTKKTSTANFALLALALAGTLAPFVKGEMVMTDVMVTSAQVTMPSKPADPVTMCEASFPTSVGFLYNGGTCEQNSIATQEIGPLSCEDFNDGPPTLSMMGELVFIRVTDGTTEEELFTGAVSPDDEYTVASPNGGTLDIIAIDTYSDETMETPLQSVSFVAACSGADTNYPMLHSFGASQVIEVTNNAQGTVSPFVMSEDPEMAFDIELSISEDNGLGAITLQELTIFAHPFMAAPQAIALDEGVVLSAETPFDVSFDLPFMAPMMVSSVDFVYFGTGLTEDGMAVEFADFENIPFECGDWCEQTE